MSEDKDSDNYFFGKLSKFSKGKTSLAHFLLIKAVVFLKDPESLESIESMRKTYKSLVSINDQINVVKQKIPNLPVLDFIEEINKFIPLWEQMPENVRLLTFAAFLLKTCSENPDLNEHFMSNENIVLGAFGKSFTQIRSELLADPFTKAITLRLEKDLGSEDPVRRVQASHLGLQDILDMAKALPDELNNEPPASTTQIANKITNINVNGNVGGDVIVGDDNNIEH
jgi:hypothetical protein